jgi:uncharacterized membrane protein YkoI
MRKSLSSALSVAAVLGVALAGPAAAQTSVTTTTVSTPEATTTKVETVTLKTGKKVPFTSKVAPSLAETAKISREEAFNLASENAKDGEVSSADLETKDGRLVYEVKVLNKDKKSSEVVVDAMTGEVVKAQQYGGLKGRIIHHKENNKLNHAATDTTVEVKSSTTVTPKP